MRRSLRRITMVLAPVVLAAAALTAAPSTAAADDGETVSSQEIAAALGNTDTQNGNLVAEPVPSKMDTDSAAVVAQGDATLDIPRDPEDGVSLEAEGAPSITIDLPNADGAQSAKKLSDGTVVYPGTDGSSQAVVPTEGGGVQMLTTIAGADAPTRYTYGVSVPEGGRVEVAEDGSAAVLDNTNTPVTVVPAPWAKDANGTAVPTHFESDGQSLMQVVDHQREGVSYPVVADPFWIPAWAVVQIIRCGFGGALGWISSAGWRWYWRAIAVVGGCLIGMR